MSKKIDILFLVDHKHRDLPALSLIAFFLKNLGVTSKLVALTEEEPVIAEGDPDYVVFPKHSYNQASLIKWKKEGRKLIIIETEGNHQDRNLTMNIPVVPDLYCFWNDIMMEKYQEELVNKGCQVAVLGFLRGDLLTKKYQNIFPSRSCLLKKYGLDESLKTITIATSTQDSHFSEERLRGKKKKRFKAFKETADYIQIVQNMRELRDKTEDLIDLLMSLPNKFNIAIKPHPNENTVYWDQFINKYDSKNISLVVGEPINHLLKISDLHLSHNVCTTTIEALIAKIPTAEIHTDKSFSLYSSEHLQLADYKIRNVEEIISIVEKVFQDTSTDLGITGVATRAKVENYATKYLHKIDGLRCKEYADYLSNFIVNNPRKQPINSFVMAFLYPTMFLRYSLIIFYRRVKTVFLGHKVKIRNQQVNRPSGATPNLVYDLHGKLVDKEFGLFDNRMSVGDENKWFKKFDKLKLLEKKY